MRTVFNLLILLFTIPLLFSSCEKDSEDTKTGNAPSSYVVNLTVENEGTSVNQIDITYRDWDGKEKKLKLGNKTWTKQILVKPGFEIVLNATHNYVQKGHYNFYAKVKSRGNNGNSSYDYDNTDVKLGSFGSSSDPLPYANIRHTLK